VDNSSEVIQSTFIVGPVNLYSESSQQTRNSNQFSPYQLHELLKHASRTHQCAWVSQHYSSTLSF